MKRKRRENTMLSSHGQPKLRYRVRVLSNTISEFRRNSPSGLLLIYFHYFLVTFELFMAAQNLFYHYWTKNIIYYLLLLFWRVPSIFISKSSNIVSRSTYTWSRWWSFCCLQNFHHEYNFGTFWTIPHVTFGKCNYMRILSYILLHLSLPENLYYFQSWRTCLRNFEETNGWILILIFIFISWATSNH